MNCTCGRLMGIVPIIAEKMVDNVALCEVCQCTEIEKIQHNNNKVCSEMLRKLGVPKRCIGATMRKEFCAFQGAPSVLSGELGLFLLGESGVGKTYQMIAWMRHHIYAGRKVAYVDFSDFLCELRADARKYTNIRSLYDYADVVFIDDFDSSNPYVFEFVYNFINHLYKEQKLMFLTAEALPVQDRLAMRIGASTIQVELIKG